MSIKTLTLQQPWASLISIGVKTIETRSWATSYRGNLAIHAGKSNNFRQGLKIGEWTAYHADGRGRGHDAHLYHPEHGRLDLPLGYIVATCELVDVIPTLSIDDPRPSTYNSWVRDFPTGDDTRPPGLWIIGPNHLTNGAPTCIEHERPFGNFDPGHYAWLLDNVVALDEPIRTTGKQGLWNWEPA